MVFEESMQTYGVIEKKCKFVYELVKEELKLKPTVLKHHLWKTKPQEWHFFGASKLL